MNKNLLTHVSIAGVDNNTKLEDLIEITSQMPKDFVEWSLLYMPGKEGVPRNPDSAWREAFFDANIPTRNSVHFCGKLSFEQLLNNNLPADVHRAQRWQLNVNARSPEFTINQMLDIYRVALETGKELVLQYHEYSLPAVRRFHDGLENDDLQRVSVLIDDSRGFGLGKTAQEWIETVREAQRAFGNNKLVYAGGIIVETVDAIIGALSLGDSPFGIDMESGVRTNNQFDREKALAVLQKALPFRYKSE